MKQNSHSKIHRGASILIGAAMGVGTVGAFASGELIGEVIVQGSATVGKGMTAIRISDSVFPYRAGEMIRSAEGSDVIVRLNGERGSVYLRDETTVTVNQIGKAYRVDGKGHGIRYLFNKPAAFNVVFDCFDIKPVGNAPEYAGSVWRQDGATMVQSVRAKFDVKVTTDQTMRVSDGDTHRGCQEGAVIKVASRTPVNQGTSLGNWALGAGVTVLGALGGASGSSSSTGSTDLSTDAGSAGVATTSSRPSVASTSSSASSAPKAPASAKPETSSPVVKPVAPIKPSNGIDSGGPSTASNGADGGGIKSPADPTSKPASPVKGGGSGKG